MVEFVQNAVDFGKKKLDKAIKFWNGLDDDKKRLYTVCAIVVVSFVIVASIAYSFGKSRRGKFI
jgi:t-SNARE complex subunit (syntaxin)